MIPTVRSERFATGPTASNVALTIDFVTSRILPQFDTPLSLLGDSTDLALLVLDRDGRVVRFNPGAERLLGHLAGEVVGRHISVLDGGDRAVAARWMTQAATA
ncbi:MAG: PAS domain S-box protein, partial [Chloroflexi bacterium]